MPEAVHYGFNNCLSLDRHTTATQYEEIVNFCQSFGFYYAVKAEDTNPTFDVFADAPGMVHVHFMTVCEMATHSHNTTDRRYGAKTKSNYRESFIRACPACAVAINSSIYSKRFSFMTAPLTSDHCVVYFSKETLLKTSKLPDDVVVLRPYISLKKARTYNPEQDAHEEAYRKLEYPEPATFESVWEYLNYRWFTARDCRRIMRPADRENACETLLAAINCEALPLPKRRSTGSSAKASPVKKERLCPRCIERNTRDPSYVVKALEPRRQFCYRCSAYDNLNHPDAP